MINGIKKIKVKSMAEAHKAAMAVAFNLGRQIKAREMFGKFLVLSSFEKVLAIFIIG